MRKLINLINLKKKLMTSFGFFAVVVDTIIGDVVTVTHVKVG